MLKLTFPDWSRHYTRQTFTGDLTAGFIVGIVALPLCIAFAIASGLAPEKGIMTGVIAGALVALLSGSPVQIAGPSGPFVVIAFGIVDRVGVNGLVIATFAAGVALLIMARAGMGSLIKFIPWPVIAGFTSGVAILLITTEFKDLTGIATGHLPESIFDKWSVYVGALSSANLYAVAVAGITVLLQTLQPKLTRRIPGSLTALIVTTIIVQMFGWPVETIGSRFGEIRSVLPAPVFPHLDMETIREMFNPATAIALLVAIEALASAVVADGMTGYMHRPNRVLSAQGFANIGTALFGCLPATAALARTATNVRNGARTPVAGLVHSLTLLLVLLVFGRWAGLIPLACLAAILTVVAYNMFEWRTFSAFLFRSPKSDAAVLFATLGVTVLVDLTTGILVGMAIAAAMFIKRMAAVTDVAVITRELKDQRSAPAAELRLPIPRGVDIYEINGPFFFGAVYKLKEALHVVRKPPKVLMIRMGKVNAMDSTGLHALEEAYRDAKKRGTTLLISEIHAQPFVALMKSGLLDTIGKDNVQATFEESITRAEAILQPPANQPVDTPVHTT
jgi:SulP family sulfate permease